MNVRIGRGELPFLSRQTCVVCARSSRSRWSSPLARPAVNQDEQAALSLRRLGDHGSNLLLDIGCEGSDAPGSSRQPAPAPVASRSPLFRATHQRGIGGGTSNGPSLAAFDADPPSTVLLRVRPESRVVCRRPTNSRTIHRHQDPYCRGRVEAPQ
jgi:hypothetical protein